MIEFSLGGDPIGELNPNLRLHYLARHRRQQEWKQRSWLAWVSAGRPRVARRAALTFVVRRARRVDPDNALASMKAVIDGLRDEPGRLSLLADDTSAAVEYRPVLFETGQQWARLPEVLIRVEALE